MFCLVVDCSSDLSVHLGEQFELPLLVLDDLAVERGENEGFILFEGGVKRRVDLQQLLGVCQRKKHIYNLSHPTSQFISKYKTDVGKSNGEQNGFDGIRG